MVKQVTISAAGLAAELEVMVVQGHTQNTMVLAQGAYAELR